MLDLHRVTARVVASQLLEEDRARQVPVVRSKVLGQVLARAVSSVDNAVRALGEGVEAGAVSLAHATQGAVPDQVITEGEGTHDLLLIDRGHGEGRGEGRGKAERTVVRIVRSTIALDVTGGRVDGRALRAEGLVDVGVEGLCVVRESFGLGEGDRDDVGLEDHRVVERGQEVHVARLVARIGRHLRDDQLSLGRCARELSAVSRGEGCDVRALAVGAAGSVAAFLRGQHVRIPVTVVVDEGDLGTHPHAALAGAQLRGERGHRVLREAQRRCIHVAGKSLVRGIDAAVDELDDLALALLGKAVGPHHLRCGTGGCIRLVATCHGAVAAGNLFIRGERVTAVEEGTLDAIRRLDGAKRRGGRLDRKTVKGVVVVAHVGDGRARAGRCYGLADAFLHLRVVRGVVGPGVARLELDDDRRRGVVRALLGRRGLGGVGLVRKGGGHADRGEREGAGRYERQRCASVVEHCRLAFFTQKC